MPVRVALKPIHMVVAGPPCITGSGLIVTVTVPVLVQPLALVPVTVYIVVDTGLATVLVHVVHDNPAPGAQV